MCAGADELFDGQQCIDAKGSIWSDPFKTLVGCSRIQPLATVTSSMCMIFFSKVI